MRPYVDCGVKLGRSAKREPLVPYGKAELLREMERCAVHAALVENMVSENYGYARGNAELEEICADEPRLFHLAACPPTFRWETREAEGYLAARFDAGARGAFVKPTIQNFDFDSFSIEPVAGACVKRGLPMLVCGEAEIFAGLREILADYPELDVVLLYSHWSLLRRLFPMLERFPNLTVDLGGTQSNDIVDVIAKNFGARRMVYSSGYPTRCMAGIKPLVEYSGLCETEKDLVAYKNACRLFNIDEHILTPYRAGIADELEAAMLEGRPLSKWNIIDIHAHVVDARDHSANTMMFNADADSIAKKTDKLGIGRVAFSSWEGLYGGGARANETVRAALKKYPDRFIGYATANPRYGGDIEDAIERHETDGFLGLKPYPQTQGLKFTDERYRPWYEYGNKRKLFMLVHSGDQITADQINEIAPLYPDLIFLMAHSGISWETARINLALAKKHENVMLELTFTAMTRGTVEFFTNEIGSERVFFGTDLPMRDPGPQLAWVVFAEIPYEDKLNILYKNAERILDRIIPAGN